MNRLTRLHAIVAVLLVLSAVGFSAEKSVPAGERQAPGLEYNRDIRPILAENCFACHGPDSAARKAGLRLDIRDEAVKTEAIVPGDLAKSHLIERISSDDPGHMMPPPKSHKKLTGAQKETLRKWIASGAEYQPHWSFIPPKRPPVPVVKNTSWVRNSVDQFVLAKLEQRGLQPAPEADRRTLARRASLDLTGLPPEPGEVEAFVNDQAPNAYERYVDRLLKSPHWGEHRGRYWLDVARYADTHGIHFDNYREIWTYRDWVINAFNANMPFDRFTLEQLAGDLLPNTTLEQRVATGFNRCNITTNEGGVIPEEYLVHYTRDRTETTSQVWLGLTAGCAVCHDHKFDPLIQKEFYELAAFFNNTTQGAMDGNIKDTPPVMPVPKVEDRPRWLALQKELPEFVKQVEARKQTGRGDFDKWVKTAKPESFAALIPTEGLKCLASLNEGSGSAVNAVIDGKPRVLTVPNPIVWEAGHISQKAYRSQSGGTISIPDLGDVDTKQPFSFGAWIKLPRRGLSGSIIARMDDQHDHRGWDLWIEGNRVGTHLVHKWPEKALKIITEMTLEPRKWYHVFVTYDGSAKAAGTKIFVNGVLQPAAPQADTLEGTTRTQVPFKIGQRHTTGRLDNVAIQDLRLYGRALNDDEVSRLARVTRTTFVLNKPADKRSTGETNELFDWWLGVFDDQYRALNAKLTTLRQEESRIKARGTVAHVMQEKSEEAKAFVLFRGEYDKRRDPVKARTPKFLPAWPADYPKNRLGLARWLLQPEHPLTARVTVNRFWQEVFGNGIVKTSGDFGIAGELPSHPELLDWLALEFRESGWDVKRFFKMLVTSSTYRQASLVTKEKLEKDPFNRLLSRGPRFRMDGESIRDYALAASGILVRKLGGPSVKPYQPEGVWEAVAMIGSDTRDYVQDKGENLYRRSLYTFWKRSAPPALMDIFNAPSRETCTVRRERTNTPLQALATLNDIQFVEAARHLAQGALKQSGNAVAPAMDYLARRLLARPFRDDEVNVVENSLKELLTFYQSHPDEAKKLITVGESKADPSVDVPTLAAWTMLTNQLMNLDEVLNK